MAGPKTAFSHGREVEALVRTLAACLFLTLWATPVLAQSKPNVGVQLMADVKTVKADEPFRVGVLVSPPAGWHIYWKVPGESGAPTIVQFSGVATQALQYPLPMREDVGGGVKAFVYEKPTLFLATAKPDAALVTSAGLTVKAHVTWLCCDADECIPGQRDVELTLPVGETAQPSDSKTDFDQWQALVPRPAVAPDVTSIDCQGELAADVDAHDFEVTVQFRDKIADVELLLAPDDSLWVSQPVIKVGERSVNFKLKVAVTSNKLDQDSIEAVLCLDLGGTRRSYSLRMPLRPNSPKR